MNIMFLGTPDFAVPSLKSLAGLPDHRVVGVITNPDQPSGRSLKLTAPPVKVCASQLGIPVYQPLKFNTDDTIELLKNLEVDLLVVVAYGRIIGEKILAAYPRRIINVHPSLLPKYRGVAPYQWAIINGERETGVSIINLIKELDAGEIILQRSCHIDSTDDARTLHDRLSAMGAEMVAEAAGLISSGTAKFVTQDHSLATYFKKIEKGFGRIDWSRDSSSIHNLVRGLCPWPSTFTHHGEDLIKIHETQVINAGCSMNTPPGTVIHADEKNGLAVACGTGALLVKKLQLASRNAQPFEAFLRGYRLAPGSLLN